MMEILYAVAAGLAAGAAMGILSVLGRQAGVVKADLVQVDGAFALWKMGRPATGTAVWIAGSLVHLFTSACIGLVFGLLSQAGLPVRSWAGVGIYTLLLWLGMLFSALPVAGVGFLGRKAGRLVWLEQLVLEAIYGVVFGLVLGV
jgi:hypothetical protein